MDRAPGGTGVHVSRAVRRRGVGREVHRHWGCLLDHGWWIGGEVVAGGHGARRLRELRTLVVDAEQFELEHWLGPLRPLALIVRFSAVGAIELGLRLVERSRTHLIINIIIL